MQTTSQSSEDRSHQKDADEFNTLLTRLNDTPDSLDDLINLILPPLIRLGLTPADLPYDYHSIKVTTKSTANPELFSHNFCSRKLPRIQSALLNRIVVNWKSSLLEHKLWKSVFCVWFGVWDGRDQRNSNSDTKRVIFAKTALGTLVASLSLNNPSARHPEIIHTACELLDILIESYSLADWSDCDFMSINSLRLNNNSVQHESEWRGFIGVLFSIPDKVSNALSSLHRGELGSFSSSISQYTNLNWNRFFSNLALQFESWLQSLSKSSPSPAQLPILATLLTKLTNIGFVKIDAAHSSISKSRPNLFSVIWDRLATSICNEHQSQSLDHTYSRLWFLVVSQLPSNELRIVISSLLSHLQASLPWKGLRLSTDETSSHVERAGAEFLRFYLGEWGGENHEVEGSPIADMVIDVVTNCEGWTIGLARCISRWTLIGPDQLNHRARLSKTALYKFSSKSQIAHGTVSHQVYLLVLVALTACSKQSNASSSVPPMETDIMIDLQFVEGLQLSLGSLRRQFRLLGMLMAELLTGFQPSNVGNLDFGEDVWKKDDDETKLCQSLRSLSRHWDPSVNHSDYGWLEIFTRSSDTKNDPDQQSVKLKAGEISENEPATLVKAQTHTVLNNQRSGMTPPVLRVVDTLLDLKISESEGFKPKIEVLSSTSVDDDELEPYIIPEDEIQTQSQPSLAKDSNPIDTAFDAQRKKKVTKPVYISELSDYLKNQDSFEHIEVGLKEAEKLIRKKQGWGTELLEHSVDVTFTLLGLNDNYDLEGFERYRQAALSALVYCVPERVAPCIVEQLFFHQYSVAQRICMLNALVLGARELSDSKLKVKSFPSQMLPLAKSHTLLMGAQVVQTSADLNLLEDLWTQVTNETLDRVEKKPEDESDSKVDLTRHPKTTRISSTLEKRRHRNEKQTDSSSRFIKQASEYFVMPMINRMWIYLSESSRFKLDRGNGKPYLGSGWAILLDPMLLTRYIESLGVMLYLARFNYQFEQVIVIESITLALRLRSEQEKRIDNSGSESVEIALLEMTLIILDGIRSEKCLTNDLLDILIQWAEFVISCEKGKTNVANLSRPTRAAIGILVRTQQILKRWGNDVVFF